MKIKLKMRIFSIFTMISIFSIGFSTWSIAYDVKAYGQMKAEQVEKFDYKESAYTISNSEYGFDFFIFQGNFIYTSNSMGFKIKIRPDLLKSNFEGQDVSLNFGIGYEHNNLNVLEMFEENNMYLGIPKNAKISLDSSVNRFLYSNDLVYSRVYKDQWTISYRLLTNILLYSEDKPSLYSICKDFQSGTSYLYLTINFDFEIKTLPDDFNEIKFIFFSGLEEART